MFINAALPLPTVFALVSNTYPLFGNEEPTEKRVPPFLKLSQTPIKLNGLISGQPVNGELIVNTLSVNAIVPPLVIAVIRLLIMVDASAADVVTPVDQFLAFVFTPEIYTV